MCFGCAMSAPERKAEAERNFALQLKAIPGPAVIDETEIGPYPVEHHPAARAAIAKATP